MPFNEGSEVLINKLISLALKGLEPLYDKNQSLFTRRIVLNQPLPMPQAWNITYSAITLLGLIKARQNGYDSSSFDEAGMMHSLVKSIGGDATFASLGLILWVDAMREGEHLNVLLDAINEKNHEDMISQCITSELSWFLTGLCYSKLKNHQNGMIEELAMNFYKRIVNNFNPNTGLFSHLTKTTKLSSIRSEIGSFADQVYSIYSLSSFYQAFGLPESRQMALQCANMICKLQGDRGEWWWHYHARQGVVASRFPVFAVHQDGMAPMALLKISGVSGEQFDTPIRKGLDWLLGGNDMAVEMIDWERNVIWRDIERVYPLSAIRYGSYALAQAGLSRPLQLLESVPARKVNREMRPYETGWLLYAFSDQMKVEGAK